MDNPLVIEDVCATWETAAAVEPVGVAVSCRTAVLLPNAGDSPRFCFVSVASPIEQIVGDDHLVVDRSGSTLAIAELAARLLDDEVAAVLAPHGPTPMSTSDTVLPDALRSRRQDIRRRNVLARFLLRQIGLEEVSSHRGAPAQLYQAIVNQWDHDLSLCIDPAMMLTLGADRQRYVDADYNARATDRLPRALGRLHDLGIRSYPRLVIV